MAARSSPMARIPPATTWSGPREGVPDRREAGRAVPVDREPGDAVQAECHRGVPRDHAAALHRLGEDDLVDVRSGHSAAFEQCPCHHAGEFEGVDAGQRPFERPPDRCAYRVDDHRFAHVPVTFPCQGPRGT